MYALDTETTLILPTRLVPMLVCVSWAHPERGAGVLHRTDPEARKLVREALRGHTTFANAPFDLGVFLRWDPSLEDDIYAALEEGRVHDIQTREKLLDIAIGRYRKEEDEDGNFKKVGYSLAEIVHRRLGIKLDKDTWRLRYHDLIHTPIEDWPEGALRYATDDAERTLEVHLLQEDLEEYLTNEADQVRAHWALHMISSYGLHTSPEVVKRLEDGAKLKLEEISEMLQEHGLIDEKGKRNTKAAKKLMIESVAVDEITLSPKGFELLREDELDREEIVELGHISLAETPCVESGNELLFAYSNYAKLQNVLKKDVKFLKRGTITPIQTRFELLMETGRTSSSAPNVQNLRRDMEIFELRDEDGDYLGRMAPGVRDCFEPRDGCLFFAADFGSAELVSLAQVCLDKIGHSQLAELLREGKDPHLWMASRVAGLSYEEADGIYNGNVAVLVTESDERITRKVLKRYRQMCKAADFGFPGGMSPQRFKGYAKGYGLDLTIEECIHLKRQWRLAFPEMDDYFKWIRAQQDDEGWFWIQQIRSNRLRGRMMFTQAANTCFQGLTADAAKAALWEVTREQFRVPSSPLYGTANVNFVHDEILGEARAEQAPEAADRLAEVMVEVYQRYTPDVPITADPVVMRWWAKGAETKRVRGRLVPHEGGARP